MKVEADTVHIKVKCKPKNGEKKATPSTSAAPAAPAAAPAKRKASEKQLEHLAKARAARAAKKAAEGGKPAEPKASTSKASTSKAAEKPKEEPKKETTFDFDELRARAREQADKLISIKTLQTIFLGTGTKAEREKRNREEAAVIISRVLMSLKITKKKGVFISNGHALTEKQGEMLVKAISRVLGKKYADSDEAKEDKNKFEVKERPQHILDTLVIFADDNASMKELFKIMPTG